MKYSIDWGRVLTISNRLLKDTTPLQRGIIRHTLLVLDLSIAMNEKDLRPTRYLLTLTNAVNFIREYFEQNPISQLGVLGMRDGIATRVSDMSGNPNDHITAVRNLRSIDPKGNPSLQNALDMARAALYHTPSHGTREVVIVLGALLTSDPGDIHDTIKQCIKDRVRVSIIGLAAQMHICAEICRKTNAGDDSCYNVAVDEVHYRELLMGITTPPVMRATDTEMQKRNQAALLMMGFPSRMTEEKATICACHGNLTLGGYTCSRCSAKVCSLPVTCPSCQLTLLLSTHLARSYHHLFPLRNWATVSWRRARDGCWTSKATSWSSCTPRLRWTPTSGWPRPAGGSTSGTATSSSRPQHPRPSAPTPTPTRVSAGTLQAREMPTPDTIVTWRSGDKELAAELRVPTGAGPHPVAVVIFGGLVSSTLLDTLLTPVIFALAGGRETARLAAADGADALQPLETY